MTPGKEQIVLHASASFKDALGTWAAEHEMPMSEVIRRAVAEYIGHELNEPARTRAPKYDTPEEAKAASYERASLLRWGNSTSSKLLAKGEIEAAMIIARAVSQKDYETLKALKAATDTEENATDAD